MKVASSSLSKYVHCVNRFLSLKNKLNVFIKKFILLCTGNWINVLLLGGIYCAIWGGWFERGSIQVINHIFSH